MGKIKEKDLTGKKFGRLTVIKLEYIKKYSYGTLAYYYLCKCDCGKYKIVKSNNLKNKHVQSCGCLKKEIVSKKQKIHGLHKSRIYSIWQGMKSRCYNKNKIEYKNYGARKILVCKEWKENFINFYNWAINNGYKDNLTIDRINNNGNYEPSNCRWVTNKEQSYNRRTNHLICFEGKILTLTEWAKIYNIKPATLWARIKYKWDIKRALTQKVR